MLCLDLIQGSLPLVILNPFFETCLKFLYLHSRYLKLHADVKEMDKLNKVGEVLGLLEAVP